MKILWISPNFLHPTTKGGQIRTLGILSRLARVHEIHYVAFEDPANPEGPERAGEYSYRAYPVPHAVNDKRSLRFLPELAASMFSPLPVAIRRYRSEPMREFLDDLLAREAFDRVVVDFLVMASSCPALERAFLFQHNVETMIWRRRAAHAAGLAERLILPAQARRMFAFEREACRTAGHVIAVSDSDAAEMREMFGAERISTIPTGVDVEYFKPPEPAPLLADLLFVGSMDWMPNVDGVHWFVREVLPLIRARRRGTTLAVVGRTPPPDIVALGRSDPGIRITGTVPDVRPYLWGAAVSVVPLRIGGGTRLKIYESMAAGVPVVSTAVGAEGLAVHAGEDIRLADRPEAFAADCVELLEDRDAAFRLAARARDMVAANFSWEQVAATFTRILESDVPLTYRHASAAGAGR
ncbi:MAG TPA: glycosyltransferase family 4 protein [Bryobacteraceae bacterium]|nr:glycosyltransferase family 4 protein [Bryobacteraceae bacterium]